ncbi:MAG: DinB family protein [Paracoccaceae bacterium]
MQLSLPELQAEWDQMRGLTLDLLAACSEEDLLHEPPGSGALWKQFRHVGGIHETYLAAIDQGRIVFDLGARTYRGGPSQSALTEYFAGLSDRHADVFTHAARDRQIDWFGEPVSLPLHLVRLIGHETLHHGQFILHWRALKHPFPASWQAWGV